MKTHTHQIQVSITVVRPAEHYVTRELLQQVLHYVATTGENPEGFTVNLIEWNKNGKLHTYEEQADIQSALNSIFKMGLRVNFPQVRKG